MTGTGKTSNAAVLELWSSYAAARDPRLRDELVLLFAPMVNYMVSRKARELSASRNIEDVIERGLLALIRSLDSYDPDTGATLEQHVWTQVHGALIGELRRTRSAATSLRGWEREIGRAAQEFTTLYGRRPSAEELRQAMGVDLETSSHGPREPVADEPETSLQAPREPVADEAELAVPAADEASVRDAY